MNFQDLLAQ